MKKIVCPKCRKDDQIRKVTSIYSEGRTDTVFTGTSRNINVAVPMKSDSTSYVGAGTSHTSMAGMSQTGLSARLAPPQEPEKKGLGCWWALLLFGAVFIVGFLRQSNPSEKYKWAYAY